MEIKINCACGTTFAFELEPVVDVLPNTVMCPNCGTDAAQAANKFIWQSRAEAPNAGPGLRVSRASAAPVAEGAAHSAPRPTPPPPVPSTAPSEPSIRRGGALKTVVPLVVLLVAAVAGGYYWFTRPGSESPSSTAEAKARPEAGAENVPAEPADASGASNFTNHEAAMLFIKHTNTPAVLAACVEFWRTKLNKRVAVSTNESSELEPNTYVIAPAHNGFVTLRGSLEWPARMDLAAEFLSRKLTNLVLVTRQTDEAGPFVFGVYEQGAKKFRAELVSRTIPATGDQEEKEVKEMKTESPEWATQQGYQPGPEGFKNFGLADADKIAQRLGLKLWDDTAENKKFIWLRE